MQRNDVSDVSPIMGLTNFTWLNVGENQISDISPLDEITREYDDVRLARQSGVPRSGSVRSRARGYGSVLPNVQESVSSKDLLSEVSGGTGDGGRRFLLMGQQRDNPVGDDVWTYRTDFHLSGSV